MYLNYDQNQYSKNQISNLQISYFQIHFYFQYILYHLDLNMLLIHVYKLFKNLILLLYPNITLNHPYNHSLCISLHHLKLFYLLYNNETHFLNTLHLLLCILNVYYIQELYQLLVFNVYQSQLYRLFIANNLYCFQFILKSNNFQILVYNNTNPK